MGRCPYCGSQSNTRFKVLSRIYNRCPRCDLIYLANSASGDEILNHYRHGYHELYADDQLSGKRNPLYGKILDQLEEKRPDGSLLDVGTGCGEFLALAQERGWKVKGLDPSIESVEVARDRYGLDVFCGSLQEYDGNDTYDVITFVNVVDHLAEPWVDIRRAMRLLRGNGLIYMRIPNGLLHSSIIRYAARYGLENLVHRYLVFHQYSFTPRFIVTLLSDSGLSNIDIVNSPPSRSGGRGLGPRAIAHDVLKMLSSQAAMFLQSISHNRLVLGTSLVVVAHRNSD